MSDTSLVDDLAELLRKHEVERAVIIDDAYDLSVVDAVDSERLAVFSAQMRAESGIREELVAMGIDCDAVVRAEESALSKLVAVRERCEVARPAVEELLISYFEQRDPLTKLEDHLTSLQIKVRRFGAHKALPKRLEADLAFIDYYLDDEPPPGLDIDDEKDYGARARRRAHAIYKRTRAHIVLMSSRVGVDALQYRFRRKAKLLKGYFRFVPKEELSRRDALRATLSMLPLAAKFRHKLHDFVDTLEARADAIRSQLMADIRELGLEDYAQLRQLSLNREGHPFGDYLLRMFGAFLTSLVIEDPEVMKRVSELDETTFESLLPIQDSPSAILGRIYLASLTERLRKPIIDQVDAPSPPGADGLPEELTEIPAQQGHESASQRAHAQTSVAIGAGPRPASAQGLIPVEFGDLFVKDDQSPVYAVMNPACDLVTDPGRSRESSDTVLLIAGQLRHLHQPFLGKRPPSFFTPMYLFGGHVYRIDWDYRRLRAVEHDRLPDELLRQGYVCERRLQLGPALELQQHFTSATSRVGLPVPPPLGRSVAARLHCRGENGGWVAIGEPLEGACVVYHMRDRDQFVVAGPAQRRIIEAVEAHAESLRASTSPWTGSGNRNQYLGTLRQSLAKWKNEFPFHRTLGTLPGGRAVEKKRELKDRFCVTIGTALVESGAAEGDAVLCLDLGPMPFPVEELELPREMEER